MANQMNEGLIQTSFHVQIKANFCSCNAHSYTPTPNTHTNTHLMSCLWFMWVLDPFSSSHYPEHLFRIAAFFFHPISNSSDPSQFFIAPTTLYSCLENPVDGGAWQATVHGITRVQHVHHLITKVICYISRLCLPLDSTFHEGRGFCLFSSWMYPRSQDSAWHVVGAQ